MYRSYLNNLQLWKIRAIFDVKLGLIWKPMDDKGEDKGQEVQGNFILGKYAAYVQMQRDRVPESEIFNGSFPHKSDQKQYQDLYGNDIYIKRPFEIQPRCYFCNNSFSLKKQVDKMN